MNSVFKALDDETRRQIIEMLKIREMTSDEIATSFSLTRQQVAHHLEILKTAKLIKIDKSRKNPVYSLNAVLLDQLLTWILKNKR
ncbi:MAG: winged helix-turn-helix transcriptional regulator [Saprospiraceae bacterium]|nr:winged helix-turn-helix transcriptional regulator [Saprospiraceae bacterium]